jgi:hypothetical protein
MSTNYRKHEALQWPPYIQTMFLKGDGSDNTGDEYVLPWIEALKDIKPESAMIYTIDRETPNINCSRPAQELERICPWSSLPAFLYASY